MDDCHKQVMLRLRRIEGQLRGIQKMIDNGHECSDIISQMSAVRSAVNNTMGIMMTENVKHIVEHPLKDPVQQRERLNKAIDMLIKK